MASQKKSVLIYEKRDRKAYISLNRPDARNAFNSELGPAFAAAVQDADQDDETLVIIVSGEGGVAFSAGGDLKEMAEHDQSGDTIWWYNQTTWQNVDENCRKPMIAAIDGFAVAGGFELALRCDIRVATAQSKFGLPEPRRSLLGKYGLHHLSRMIPMGEAMMMQLTGSYMDAERAYQIGLIQRLVPNRQALMNEADAIADDIILCAPLAVQAIKRIVKVGRNVPPEYSFKFSEPIRQSLSVTEDRIEGVRAFNEKRRPNWKMK